MSTEDPRAVSARAVNVTKKAYLDLAGIIVDLPPNHEAVRALCDASAQLVNALRLLRGETVSPEPIER